MSHSMYTFTVNTWFALIIKWSVREYMREPWGCRGHGWEPTLGNIQSRNLGRGVEEKGWKRETQVTETRS